MTKVLKILLVDDDLALVKTLTMFLQYEGHEVTAVSNPLEARTIAQRENFDLLITDMVMTEMNGFELVQSIRQLQNLEAILITGYWDKIELEPNLNAHFKAVLPKPLDIDRLAEELDSIK